MKKFFIIAALLLVSTVTAQYTKSSISATMGVTKIQDVTPFELITVSLKYRNMLNTKFGIELAASMTQQYNWGSSPMGDELEYKTLHLYGVANVGRVLNFESFTKNYTLLFGLGGSLTRTTDLVNQSLFHRNTNFHISYNIENEYRINNSVSLNTSLNVINDVNNRPNVPYINTGKTTNIFTISFGMTISLDSNKEHADFYIEEENQLKRDAQLLSTFSDLQKHALYVDNVLALEKDVSKIKNNLRKLNRPVENQHIVPSSFVLFDHNKFNVGKTGMENILNIGNQMEEGDKMEVTAYTSTVGSTKDNLTLAEKRYESVYKILLSLGLDDSMIIKNVVGELSTIDNKNLGLARQVRLDIRK